MRGSGALAERAMTPGRRRALPGPRAVLPGAPFAGLLPEDRQPVIIAARRTPLCRANGALKQLRAHELLAPVLRSLLAVPRPAGPHPASVTDVVIGNAVGGGGNVARLAALEAGLPVTVPGVTVDRQCGSGLDAIVLAARLVAAGGSGLYLAGGVESISTAPLRAHRNDDGSPDFYSRAQFAPLSLGDPDMGVAAENVAARFGISRERQDEFALRSHRRALAAAAAGRFDAEIVPLGMEIRRSRSGRRRSAAQSWPGPDGQVPARVCRGRHRNGRELVLRRGRRGRRRHYFPGTGPAAGRRGRAAGAGHRHRRGGAAASGHRRGRGRRTAPGGARPDGRGCWASWSSTRRSPPRRSPASTSWGSTRSTRTSTAAPWPLATPMEPRVRCW